MELSKEYKSLTLNLPLTAFSDEFELDYQENIPAYLDDVEKIIKCSAKCTIVDYEINSTCINLYGKTLISVTYISSQGAILSNIFEEDFSKAVDIDGKNEISFADVSLKLKYSSSRLINQRRIDVHISLEAKIKSFCRNAVTVLKNCKNAFVKEYSTDYLINKYSGVSSADFDENFNVSNNSQIKNIVNAFSSSSVEEYKVIKEKMLVKIKTGVSILYTTDDDAIEKFDYSFSSSKIIDLPNTSDEDKAMIDCSVSSLYVKTKADKDNKLNEVEIIGRISVSYKIITEESGDFITDSYMTSYNTKSDYNNIPLFSTPLFFSNTASSQLSFNIDGGIKEVLDANITILYSEIINSKLRFGVKLDVLYYDSQTNIRYAEKSIDDEVNLTDTNQSGFSNIELKSFDYVISSQDSINVKANVQYSAYLYDEKNISFISDIEVSGEKDKSSQAPLTLYFAQKGESVWNIAKDFSTDLIKICDDNDIKSDVISENKILLVSEI